MDQDRPDGDLMAWEVFHGQGGRGRAWKEGEDRHVLAATGYAADDALAQRLGRTVAAIPFAAHALETADGMSALSRSPDLLGCSTVAPPVSRLRNTKEGSLIMVTTTTGRRPRPPAWVRGRRA